MRSSVPPRRNQSRPAVGSETKSVTIFINGDEYFSGLNYVVSHKTTKTFSALLNNLSEKLQPKFGAVRALYDIENGKKILKLEDLKNYKRYAVAGIEGLKRCEKWFQEAGQYHYQQRVSRKPTNQILPHYTTTAPKATFAHRSKNYTNKSSDTNEPLTIYVYRNGDFKNTPIKFILTKQQTTFWDKVLQNISQKVLPEVTYIRNGFRLCALNGHVLNGVEELSRNQTYVAVGNFETFRRRPYAPVETNRNPVAKTVPKWQPPPPIVRKDVARSLPEITTQLPPEEEYDDFDEYEEDDEEEDAEDAEEEREDEEIVKPKDEDGVVDYSDDKFEEDEDEQVEEESQKPIEEEEVNEVEIQPAIQSLTLSTKQLNNEQTEDEGFHSGPSSSNQDAVIEKIPHQQAPTPQHHHPPILPEFLKSTALETLSPETDELETIRHSYMGFYDSPLPTYSSTSKAVVAVGSGNRRPSFYYTAATNTFRRASVMGVGVGGETQAEIDKKLRLEADPNNVFHAKGENALTRHAPEIQETKDTLVDLPVDFWEAHEVLEEIPEDPPPEIDEQNKNGNKFRSSTFAY